MKTLPAITLLLLLATRTFCSAQSVVPAGSDDRSAAQRVEYAARAYPFERIAQNARLEAALYSEMRMRPYKGAASPQHATRWTPIGPFDLAGRVMTIAAHPSDGNTVWIGAADGGVWRSADRGAHWEPVMDNEAAIAMGAIAVDPSNPNILYAGTGEASPFIDAYGGAGIMRSTDAGVTWRGTGLRNVGAFSRIAVHPGNGAIVFAAATKNNAGLYRSVDSGATWTRILGSPVTDITISRSNPNDVWIGGGDAPVMHSADAGVTFVPSAAGIGANAVPTRVSVQVAQSSPNVLYALAQEVQFSPPSSASRIYKSTNAGASWQVVMDNDPDLLNYFGHVQGDYNNVIAVAPDDPNVVIAGGVVLIRSVDGGQTWTTFDSQLHPDHHAIAFDPTDPTRVYVGNDGGMYRSDNRGGSYARTTSGLAITQFYAMAVDQTAPATTYGGTQDNGTVTTEATEYRNGGPGIVGGGDGFHVVVDRSNPSIVYYEQPYGAIIRKDLGTGAEQTFTQGISTSDQGAWAAPLIADPADSSGLYCGRRRVYHRTASTRWSPISPTFRTPISAIAVSEANPRIVYAGSGLASGSSILVSDGVPLGELKVTTDGGATWADRNLGLPNRIITSIVASRHDTCTAYVTFSGFSAGHIFKTTDCGATWGDISRGLPDIPVNALVLDPSNERVIHVGTDIGMFVSDDGGATWWTFNNGLPRVAVVAMEIHRASNTLRVATHGRSMWEIALGQPDVQPAITAPVGRETWMGRTHQNIAWAGLQSPVDVLYSVGGGTWMTAATGVTGSRLDWVVPDIDATTAQVRVVERGGANRSIISAEFTIERSRPGGVISASLQALPCWGLAFDGDVLWASVENSDTLLTIDPGTLIVRSILKLKEDGRHRLTDITWHPGRRTLFAHDVADATPDSVGGAWLVEFDREGTILNRWVSPCSYPTGLVWLDSLDGGSLLASDLFGAQNMYVIDPSNGSVRRVISPSAVVDLGPAGLASAGDGRSFWRVIDDFDPNSGPRGSSLGLYAPGEQASRCSFPLRLTPDSASALGYSQWGKLFARGVERDPVDGNLWVTNLDGAIYKVVRCEPEAAGVPDRGIRQGMAPGMAGDVKLSVSPNPVRLQAGVHFVLQRAAGVRIELFDNTGRSVALITEGRFDGGEHEVGLNTRGLPSGLYRCRIAVDGRLSADAAVVIVR